jgi:hypothetical protein
MHSAVNLVLLASYDVIRAASQEDLQWLHSQSDIVGALRDSSRSKGIRVDSVECACLGVTDVSNNRIIIF